MGALGLDYRTNEDQFPGIERMLDLGKELMTGPVDLVQGGKGLILRAPVYWPDPDFATEGDVDGSKRQLWGIVSLVLDYDQFLINSGIREAEERYDILIHAASPQVGVGPQMFTYGDQSLLEADTVTLEFDFSFEEWML